MSNRKVTTFYMTTFMYGSTRTICSKHKTFYAAKRAARKCEKRGGAFHDEIWEVVIYPREKE